MHMRIAALGSAAAVALIAYTLFGATLVDAHRGGGFPRGGGH
jgi:hypothetical protein